jgi:hypothetical protein
MASQALSEGLRIALELGHYRVVEKIDAVGRGVVHPAPDERPVCDVAIKILRAGTPTAESVRKAYGDDYDQMAPATHQLCRLGSMHYEIAAWQITSGELWGGGRKIEKATKEWPCTLRERLR